MPPLHNLYETLQKFTLSDGIEYQFYALSQLEKAAIGPVSRLPICIRIILESLLRNYDGNRINLSHITKLANWEPQGHRVDEIPFIVARVILQDFTGVPLLADLAAMRTAMVRLDKDPAIIEPRVPVDLVIDHSVQIDSFANKHALSINMDLEFKRNKERYQFLKWGMQAFEGFNVVPPGVGIVHQINLEYLAQGVSNKNQLIYPDTVVGTDSHTPMINGAGIVGWGVGGIEAEAAMLGQPVYILTPDVVGVELKGDLAKGVTATDLVLTVTELLRKAKVVGKFIEFFGEGVSALSLPDRATIANMAPEYGATMGFFPIDEITCDYLLTTGRSSLQVEMIRAYYKAQNMFGIPTAHENIQYTQTISLDLNTIMPCVAGPKRPQDRIALPLLAATFNTLFSQPLQQNGFNYPKAQLSQRVQTSQGTEIGHGDILIAAITSCTNTSNPSVLIAAGLLAKKAVAKGLKIKSHIKTSFAPGSRAVTVYLQNAGLLEGLAALGFEIAAYGCTTCIGNSGPLRSDIHEAIIAHNLITAAVLSGNRNFEARIHPDIKANFLMSPPLVVAFAIAGRVNINIENEPLGIEDNGASVFLGDIWPTQEEINALMHFAADPALYRRLYSNLHQASPLWNNLPSSTGKVYKWDKSTYIACPPFLDKFTPQRSVISAICGAKPLLILGDSVTTDHISPAGSFDAASPAGKYLIEQGVNASDFNSYGSRRGNHEIMVRGTFANVRIKNLMLTSGIEGGFTLYHGQQMPVYEAAMNYMADNIPTIILAGEEYGTGSSRDWAAKGALLLGVKVVLARSFERIHRSNLVGMGILPLQFKKGNAVQNLNLIGDETFDVLGLDENLAPQQELTVAVKRNNSVIQYMQVLCRIDTPIEVAYYKHGGILPYTLRELIQSATE